MKKGIYEKNLQLTSSPELPWWLKWSSLTAVQETQVRFLGQEDPLEEEMATHSSILAMDGGAWWLQSIGSQESDTTWQLNHQHPEKKILVHNSTPRNVSEHPKIMSTMTSLHEKSLSQTMQICMIYIIFCTVR